MKVKCILGAELPDNVVLHLFARSVNGVGTVHADTVRTKAAKLKDGSLSDEQIRKHIGPSSPELVVNDPPDALYVRGAYEQVTATLSRESDGRLALEVYGPAGDVAAQLRGPLAPDMAAWNVVSIELEAEAPRDDGSNRLVSVDELYTLSRAHEELSG